MPIAKGLLWYPPCREARTVLGAFHDIWKPLAKCIFRPPRGGRGGGGEGRSVEARKESLHQGQPGMFIQCNTAFFDEWLHPAHSSFANHFTVASVRLSIAWVTLRVPAGIVMWVRSVLLISFGMWFQSMSVCLQVSSCGSGQCSSFPAKWPLSLSIGLQVSLWE